MRLLAELAGRLPPVIGFGVVESRSSIEALSECLLRKWLVMCYIFSRLPAFFVPTKTALFLFALGMLVPRPNQVFVLHHGLALLLAFLLSPRLEVWAQSRQVAEELLEGAVAIEQRLRLGAALLGLLGDRLKVASGRL